MKVVNELPFVVLASNYSFLGTKTAWGEQALSWGVVLW
jgi:hypothetical protein